MRTFSHKFDGDAKKLTSFIAKCDAFFKKCPAEWQDELYFTVTDSLIDRVGNDYSQVRIAQWVTLRKWLRRTYKIKSTYDAALVDLSQIIQKSDEKITDYSFRLTEQSRFIWELGIDEGLHPATLDDVIPRALSKQLINGTISAISEKLSILDSLDFDFLLQKALTYESQITEKN